MNPPAGGSSSSGRIGSCESAQSAEQTGRCSRKNCGLSPGMRPPHVAHFGSVDPAIARRQVERLKALRTRRDPARVAAALARIRAAAAGTANLMPLFIDAVESYVTLGEICDTLRSVWGEQRETMAL